MPITAEKKQSFDQFLAGFQDKLKPEAYETLRSVFADPVETERAQDYVAQNTMNLADFSRRGLALNDEARRVDELRARLEHDVQQVANYNHQLQQWENYLNQNTVSREDYQEAQREIALLTQYRDQVQTQIRDLDLEGVITTPATTDPNTNGGRSAMPDNRTNPAAHNPSAPASRQAPERPSTYVSEMQMNQALMHGVIASTISTAQLFDLNNTYQQLTGAHIENIDKLVEEAVRVGKPAKEYIEEKLEFAKLREQKSQKDLEARIEASVQERVAKLRSEQQLPFGAAQRSSGGVLANTLSADPVRKDRPVQPGRPGEGAARAAEAWSTGKYRGEHGSGILG